jgi:hypothetical protein
MVKEIGRKSDGPGFRIFTADPPKDGSATTFKAEERRTPSKEFLTKTYSELCELRVSVVNLSSSLIAALCG